MKMKFLRPLYKPTKNFLKYKILRPAKQRLQIELSRMHRSALNVLGDVSFRPGEFPRRCTAGKCTCTYEGIHFSSPRGSAAPSHIVVKPAKFLIETSERLTGLKRPKYVPANNRLMEV